MMFRPMVIEPSRGRVRGRGRRSTTLLIVVVAMVFVVLAPTPVGAVVTLPDGKSAWNSYFGPYPNVPSIPVPGNPLGSSQQSVAVPGGRLTVTGAVAYNTPFRVQFAPEASSLWRAYDPADQNPATNGNYRSVAPAQLTPPRLGVYAPTGYRYVAPQVIKVSCATDYDCTYLIRDTENRREQWWFTLYAGDYLVRAQTGTTNPPGLEVANAIDSAAVDLVVNPGPPIPTASFTYVGTGTPNEFSFLASPSSDSNVPIVRYDWDFGDGQTVSNGPSNPTHTYTSSASSRVVTLTATFSNGLASIARVTLTPVLKIASVMVDPTPTPAGTPFALKVTLRNDGPSTLTGAAPTVALGPTAVAATTGAPTPASATLAPGQRAVFTLAAMGTAAGGRATADINATATGGGGAVSAAAVRRSFVVGGAVSATLAGPTTAPTIGKDFTVTLTATNNSGDRVQLTPSALLAVPSDGLTITGPTPVTVGPLGDGLTATFTYKVQATTPATLQLDTDLAVTDLDTLEASSVHATGTVEVASDRIVVNTASDEPLTDRAKTDKKCNTDADSTKNVCTLRAGIQLANALAAENPSKTYGIGFAIPTAGFAPTIAPLTSLPAITARVDIDGTTQPGSWVELSGLSVPRELDPETNTLVAVADGLTLTSATSSVRGLVVGGWRIGIQVSASDVHVVGNRIGTDDTGMSASSNVTGVQVTASGARIGGTGAISTDACSGDCNLISGNGTGVRITGAGSGTAVVANTIGTDVSGTNPLPNDVGVSAGPASDGGAMPSGIIIGGATALAGTGPGNLLSGNRRVQVLAFNAAPESMVIPGDVIGNLIGTDRAGARAMNPDGPSRGVSGRWKVTSNVISGFGDPAKVAQPDQQDLLIIDDRIVGVGVAGATEVTSNLIGTDRTGLRRIANFVGIDSSDLIKDNTVSGNYIGVLSFNSTIDGNRIGTDLTGRQAIGNEVGVEVRGDDLQPSLSTLVGGVRAAGSTSCTGPCNLISGNKIGIIGGPSVVQGNVIGLDVDGLTPVPNQTAISAGSNRDRTTSLVGGASAAVSSARCDLACNLISGNSETAVDVGGSTDVQVAGNVIGEGFDGRRLPNGGSAVTIRTLDGMIGSVFVLIGGDAERGNRIIGNAGPAIAHGAAPTNPGLVVSPVEVRGNAIAGNSAGIFYPADVTPRPFRSPRDLTATRVAGGVRITGTLGLVTGNSLTARVDLYASPTCEASPQGLLPIGSLSLGPITDGTFDTTVAVPTTYTAITATATSDRSTSLFSDCALTEGSSTTVSVDAPVGTTELKVESNSGFAPGDFVRVGTGSNAPVRKVDRLGSLVFGAPLPIAVPAGTIVTKVDPPGGDVTAPTITVVSPAAAASVTQGSTVAVQVTCDDAAGVGVEACRYPVNLETASAGPKTLVVSAWDRNGNATTRTVSYTVTSPPPPPPPVSTLSVTWLQLTPAWWFLPPTVHATGVLSVPKNRPTRCRDVTVAIGNTSMTQTVKASTFRRIGGLCVSTAGRGGFIRTLVVNPTTGEWAVFGVAGRHDAGTIGRSSAIRIKIGTTEATTTVPLVRRRNGTVSLRR